MRIAIYGAGGLGAYYGTKLALATSGGPTGGARTPAHDVHFIARGAHLEAMCQHGLKVLSVEDDMLLPAPNATRNPAEIGPVDLVVVAVKTWQIPDAAVAMAPLLGPDTVVLPFLNGVESADQIGAVIGMERMVGGLSRVFSLIEAPGVIRHFKPGAYVGLGELDGAAGSDRVQAIVEMFEGAGIEAEQHADIRSELWKKLLMVSSWAGIGALTRSPIGAVRADDGARRHVDASMDEGIAVGRARGHTIGDDFKAFLWDFYGATPPEATASMMRDILAGRPSELHAWNGAIVRFGEACGVPTPTHAFVLDLLAVMEAKARGAA